MSVALANHVRNLQDYLLQPSERNEDLAIAYFRSVYGAPFQRQSDAANADGYVAGHFILELKGHFRDWYSALFQGLAYERNGLSFSLVVVCAKGFLGIWRTDDIPDEIRNAILSESVAASTVGRQYAKRYINHRAHILRKAVWYRPELEGELFLRTPDAFESAIKSFQSTLDQQRKVRQPITLSNFVAKLKEMVEYFDRRGPIRAVRAFYSMIYGPWDDASVVSINRRHDDRATLGGAEITDLVPARRNQFKQFVENHSIRLGAGHNVDDFFSKYDEALDVVDKDFRVKHGIFFTDLDLARFSMWLVKRNIPSLGRNYLVIDPACGSGNLVTNWRSPLELRHKVVSEIEPELLYAVEQRMKGDQWHNGKFTVVPKVSENIGLNFLDKPAKEYLSILKHYLSEKGHHPDKPIAFLCNPPYRSDDDQSADSIVYKIDTTITDLVGKDAASERYCCFLGQMKLICQSAADSGLPDGSILILFTKAAWLTRRLVFKQIRREILGAFENVHGVLIDGSEFFDVKGKFPIAFTVWRYKGADSKLDAERVIPLVDLTHIRKKELAALPWSNASRLDAACSEILSRESSVVVHLGLDQESIRTWVGQTMIDFKRSRRVHELQVHHAGGLPKSDRRLDNTKVYGESDGTLVGFMDDLTPCRISKGLSGVPSFHLDSRFMRVRAYQCFSGLPDNRGYQATDRASASKLFLWYALGKTFSHCGYPMWVDALELWKPEISRKLFSEVEQLSFAIGYAENSCVDIVYPGGNPVKAAIEIRVENPMTPLNPHSFWCRILKEEFAGQGNSVAHILVHSVNQLYKSWKKQFNGITEIIAEYERPYFVGPGLLTEGAGLIQIRDYAVETNEVRILEAWKSMQETLKKAKQRLSEMLLSKTGISYFSQGTNDRGSRAIAPFTPATKFDRILEKRIAIAATIINSANGDKNFGLTKFVKLFYLADVTNQMALKTDYSRHAAGPLDSRALYNSKVGLLPVAERHGYFDTRKDGPFIRIEALENFDGIRTSAKEILGTDYDSIQLLVKKFAALDTDQAEIIATLFACWNDLLLDDVVVSDDMVIREFLLWHSRKARFPKTRLRKALSWMKLNKVVPKGIGQHTSLRPDDLEMDARNRGPFSKARS